MVAATINVHNLKIKRSSATFNVVRVGLSIIFYEMVLSLSLFYKKNVTLIVFSFIHIKKIIEIYLYFINYICLIK